MLFQNNFGLVCLKVDDSLFQQCLSISNMPYMFTLHMPLYHEYFQRFDFAIPVYLKPKDHDKKRSITNIPKKARVYVEKYSVT